MHLENKKGMVEERKRGGKRLVASSSELLILKRAFIQKQENIDDNYTRERRIIGAGSFGTVCLGVHKTTGETRAIKQIKKEYLKTQKYLKIEYEVLREVDHPNIAKLFEWYEDRYSIYLVCEYCEGGQLLDLILHKRQFTEKNAALYFKQILSAISHCHKLGICHRDLKPSNILLDSKENDANIKLIDFGIAEILDKSRRNVTQMHSYVGTPHFLPPEVMDHNYNITCDIWSAGVVLYFLLSGRFPFGHDKHSIQEVLEEIKKGKVYYFDDVWENVSDDAIDLINKCLVKQENRITAEEALEHPWITNLAQMEEKQFTADQMNRLKGYRKTKLLKKAVLEYIATQSPGSDMKDLNLLFNSLDTNGDGKLSYDEFKKGMGAEAEDEEIRKIMEAIDINKTGFINYSEFLAATMDETMFLKTPKLRAAFSHFDKVRFS